MQGNPWQPKSEEREQAELVAWFKREHGEAAAARLHHSPNGGARHKATAARMKLLGVRRGFPDLVLYLPRHGRPGLAIEFKPTEPARRVSKEQRQWLEWLAECGFEAHVARGIEEAQQILTAYMEGAP